MCGICGILNYGNSSTTFDENLLVRMRDTMKHRGPDDAGTFISPRGTTGFGFRRLAIVDLSPAGHQPMQSPDKSITIVLNGEIYNHLVLRREFEAKGYRYASRSDTETIIYAYLEYGVEFVHKLLGMFAIAIWDEPKQRLIVARDRIGIKPLYYTFVDGNFIFGSEVKAILQHTAVHTELNEEALDHYLTFLIPPAPHTLFKGIHKLEPGHRMIIDTRGNITKEQYWNPVAGGTQPSIDFDGKPVERSVFNDEDFPLTEEHCTRTIRSLLKQSIKDRMMSDVPFGVFLSGGIDSSINVALMAELMDRPVDTFSVGMRQLEKYNELGYARQIAKQFKTNHQEIIIDQKDAFDFLTTLVHHQDEPLADPVCIPLYFVSTLARKNGTIVVQVGEGSDEQFAGYQWMLRELKFYRTLWKGFRTLPRAARSFIHTILASPMERRHSYLALDYIRKAVEGDELFWGGAINFTETHKRRLMNERRRSAGNPSGEIARAWHAEALDRQPSMDYLNRMIYLEFKSRLPELLLMRVDKMSMATSVEARVPFLDHRMVEYSMRIPVGLKIRNGEPKYILKKAVEGIIPNNIIYRKKQGFAAPVNEWLRNEWSGFAKDKLLNSFFVREGYFNREFIVNLLTDHHDGKRNEGQNIWNLLNLTLWHEHWLEGKSSG
jgi:asparagine synthase (glutamine-hydrolysing)